MSGAELCCTLDSASSHSFQQGPLKNTKFNLLRVHTDLELNICNMKNPFSPSSVQVSFHCDTEGPIETDMYLHCSVVCVSLCLTISPGVSKSLGWNKRIVNKKQAKRSYKAAYHI